MNKIVIIELPRKRSTQDLFCGYIESKLRFKDGDPKLSRCHSQQKRIHSVLGVAPAVCAEETLGRYNVLIEYG